jgi:hypothetical protein
MNTTYYRECDTNDIECLSPLRVDPLETDFAALAPRFSGSLSAISSALIIYVILRSEKRLSSIYHRIMFGMSLSDVCGSIAIALTSLPMPSHMPKEEVFGYHWAGTRMGNTYTCNAQGFFIAVGVISLHFYISALCVYYACAIAFAMKEHNIKKYVEPLLHGTAILAALAFSVPPLFTQMYNTGISMFAWCGPIAYPDECNPSNGVECIRGTHQGSKLYQTLITVIMISVIWITLLFLGMVVCKVIQTDRKMEKIFSAFLNDEGNEDIIKNLVDKHNFTKAVLIQAFSYIAALIMGVLPPTLILVGATDKSSRSVLERSTLVLFPLQGFFNSIIFMSFKVYNFRRVQPDASICHIIGLLFCKSWHDPCFISRISIVEQYEQEKEENDKEQHKVGCNSNVVYDIGMTDEANDDHHFRLQLMTFDPEKNNNHSDIISEFSRTTNSQKQGQRLYPSLLCGGGVGGSLHLGTDTCLSQETTPRMIPRHHGGGIRSLSADAVSNDDGQSSSCERSTSSSRTIRRSVGSFPTRAGSSPTRRTRTTNNGDSINDD